MSNIEVSFATQERKATLQADLTALNYRDGLDLCSGRVKLNAVPDNGHWNIQHESVRVTDFRRIAAEGAPASFAGP